MNTELVMAVNEVEYLDGRKKEYAKPGNIFPLDSDKVAKLKKMGAVRAPTDAEMALYEKQASIAPKKRAKSADTGDDDAKPSTTKGRPARGGKSDDKDPI